MSILTIFVIILLVCLGFWANNSYVSPPPLRIIINVVLILIVLWIILSVAGILPLANVRV